MTINNHFVVQKDDMFNIFVFAICALLYFAVIVVVGMLLLGVLFKYVVGPLFSYFNLD